MDSNSVILLRLAVGAAGLVAFLAVQRDLDARGWPAHRTRSSVLVLWLVSRLGLFVALYVASGLQVPSDVPQYYYPVAKSVLAGHVPYRDFESSYGPLFPYLGSLILSVWDSPKAFVLFAVVVEGASILLWVSVATRRVAEQQWRLGLLLYVCSALPILNVAIAGQNQVWLSALLAVGLVLTGRGKAFATGCTLALSAAAVKVVGLIFVPYWWLSSHQKARFAAGVGVVLIAVVIPFWLAGADLLQPLRLEGGQISSGNIPYLLTAAGVRLSDPTTSVVSTVLLLAGLLGASVMLQRVESRQQRAGPSLVGLSVVLLLFMLLSKKAYTNYFTVLWLPLCIASVTVLTSTTLRVGFLAWCAVASVEPSLWVRWIGQHTLNDAFRQPAGATAFDPRLPLFVTAQIIVLAGSGWLLYRLSQEVRRCGD